MEYQISLTTSTMPDKGHRAQAPYNQLLQLLRAGRARVELAHYRRFAVSVPGKEFPALFITLPDDDDAALEHDAYTINAGLEERCLTENEADEIAEILSPLAPARPPEVVLKGDGRPSQNTA
jgi:hypothetical protein